MTQEARSTETLIFHLINYTQRYKTSTGKKSNWKAETQEKEILYLVHPWIMEISSGLKCPLKQAMHEKPYLLSSGILWKAQKDQVNIIFSSTFWLRKRPFPISEKFKTRTFQ